MSLCEKGCIYAKISMEYEVKETKYGSWYKTGRKVLTIFCSKKFSYIQKIKLECNDYQNSMLTKNGVEKFW